MRFRVSSQGPEAPEVILEIEGTKFHVDPVGTAALFVAPKRPLPDRERHLDFAKRILPVGIVGMMNALGLNVADLSKDFEWPACGWFPHSTRTHQDHLFAFHFAGRPTETTDQRGGEWRWTLENPHCDRPIELRIARSQHPDRQHLLVLWVKVPGVACP